MELLGIFGAGGFGREVMFLALNTSRFRGIPIRFVVDEPPVSGFVNNVEVMSTAAFVSEKRRKGFVVAVADPQARERLHYMLAASGGIPEIITAPTAVAYGHNEIGDGVFCDGTICTVNAQIGRSFHMNVFSYVAHDCVIGNFVTFAPSVMCNGNVTIGDRAYIGAGVTIRQKLTIGKDAVIGMGAVVTKSVPDGVTVVGNPARIYTKLRTDLG